jgi:GTPase SAR1 family protein
MILYSVDDAGSFDNAQAMRKKIERAKDVDNFPMVLVGNKCDLTNRSILSEKGQAKALEMGCPFIETSAKAGVRSRARSPSRFYFLSLGPQNIHTSFESPHVCFLHQINVKEAFDLLVREVRKDQHRPAPSAKKGSCCVIS